MVGIDPANIETLDLGGGWLRFDKRDTWDRAVAELRPKVLVQAGMPLLRKEADESGKQAMLNLLQPMAEALATGGIKVDVHFREEP